MSAGSILPKPGKGRECGMKRSVYFVTFFILAAILWETLFSGLIYNIPERYYRDSVTEWVPKPYETVVYSEEGYGRDRYNNVSALGPDISIPKKNVFRILVFGDSHTQAFQVMPRQKFTDILGEKLNDSCRKRGKPYKVEVVNLAVNGYSAADYIYYLDYYIARLQPDYLIFQLNHDDFIQALEQRPRYSYVQINDKKVSLSKDDRKENFLALLLERHGLYNNFARLQGKFSTIDYTVKVILPKILQEIRNFTPGQALSQAPVSAVKPAQGTTPPVENKITLIGEQVRQIPDDSLNLNNTKVLSSWFFTETARRKIPAAILMLPYYPTKWNGFVELASEMEDKRLTAIAEQALLNGVTVVNLKEDFLSLYHTTRRFPRGFYNTPVGIGHPNPEGHKLIAEKLVRETGGFLP